MSDRASVAANDLDCGEAEVRRRHRYRGLSALQLPREQPVTATDSIPPR